MGWTMWTGTEIMLGLIRTTTDCSRLRISLPALVAARRPRGRTWGTHIHMSIHSKNQSSNCQWRDDDLVLLNHIRQPPSGKERNTTTGKNTSVIRTSIKTTNPIPTKSNQVRNDSALLFAFGRLRKQYVLSPCASSMDDTATKATWDNCYTWRKYAISMHPPPKGSGMPMRWNTSNRERYSHNGRRLLRRHSESRSYLNRRIRECGRNQYQM